MKKVCVVVLVCMLFLLFPCQSNAWSFGEFFDEVGSTVYGAAAGAKDLVSWCNGLSQDELTKYANDVWNGNPQKIQEVAQKYNYYVDPRQANQRGCLGNAASIISAITHKCSTECASASDAATENKCKSCQTVVETMFNQYKADKKAVEQEKCERDAALATVGKVALGGGLLNSTAGTALYAGILAVFFSYQDGCWTCPIFDTVYNTGNNLAASLYASLRDVALALLAIFAFAWTLFQVLKFVTTLHAPNIGEFLTRLFKTLGLVAIMAAFLPADVSFLTGYFIDVPSLMALDLNDKILEAGGFGNDVAHYQTYSQDSTNDKCAATDSLHNYTADDHTVNLCPSSNSANYAGKPMSAALHDRLICMLKKISVRLIKGIAMGATFLVASFTDGWNGIIPSFSMFVVGILVFCCYFSFFIKIPVYLIDIVLRLCFLVITLPIYVVCFPFPSTRGYTKKAWEMLLSLLVHIISLCIFVALALSLIEQALAIGGK